MCSSYYDTILARRDLDLIDGFTITATLTIDGDEDTITVPDWATPADYQALLDGEWVYALLTVTASRAGHTLGTAYLGGVVHGTLASGTDCDGFSPDYLPHLVVDAISDARDTLALLTAPDRTPAAV